MKFFLPSVRAACVALLVVMPEGASAKSVKWSCVALDPLTPFTFTCFPSTSRP